LVERFAGVGGRPQPDGAGDQGDAGRLAGPVAEAAAQRVPAPVLAELAAYRRRRFSPAT
jgi:hypothetical protein